MGRIFGITVVDYRAKTKLLLVYSSPTAAQPGAGFAGFTDIGLFRPGTQSHIPDAVIKLKANLNKKTIENAKRQALIEVMAASLNRQSQQHVNHLDLLGQRALGLLTDFSSVWRATLSITPAQAQWTSSFQSDAEVSPYVFERILEFFAAFADARTGIIPQRPVATRVESSMPAHVATNRLLRTPAPKANPASSSKTVKGGDAKKKALTSSDLSQLMQGHSRKAIRFDVLQRIE